MIEISHLLDIATLGTDNIQKIMARAEQIYQSQFDVNREKSPLFQKTVMLLFFENSTRTMASFELAAKKLGADVINIPVPQSSTSKGESFKDTVLTLNAMQPAALVVRHSDSGSLNLITKHVSCPVLNAGDGTRAHPTQALLDALTIKLHKSSFKELIITICGDIRHSRVARSNIELLIKLGATVRIAAPPELLPDNIKELPVTPFTTMQQGLEKADVIMMLRVQKERMQQSYIQCETEYARHYGLDHDKLDYAKPDAIVMHPGPINRGLEISEALADDQSRNVILQQVTVGVAVRMACLEFLTTP